LVPFIDVNFTGQIWKFVLDQSADLLFAELRESEERKVSFASLDLNTGAVNFNDLTLPEKWLSGLQGSFNGTLFLHGYLSAQSPIHKGIIAFDGDTGTELWSNYASAISNITINGPVAFNPQVQPPLRYLLDAKTGATLRPYNASVDTEVEQHINLPDILTTIPSGFNIFFDGDVTGNFHYMEHNGFRIVSLHTINNDLLKQHLFVTLNGDIVYADLLTDEIQKLQPESFIMYKNQLIYIKNAKELKILNL